MVALRRSRRAVKGPRGSGRASISSVYVSLSLLEGEPLSEGWTAKPFTPSPGFNDRWWLGNAKDGLVYCYFTTQSCGEVARAEVRLHSTVGEAYPTYSRPRLGSTEIDLLEV